MKTNFFKIATIVALGAVSFLSSCNKEELEGNKDERPSQENIKESNYINVISADSTNIECEDTSIVAFSAAGGRLDENGLRSQRDVEGGEYWYLQDLMVWEGKNPPEFYRGYALLDVDLNMGAGGEYLYLYAYFTTKKENAVTSISAYYNTNISSSSNVVKTTDGRVADLNKGTKKGGKINLVLNRGGSTPIQFLSVVAYKHAANDRILGAAEFRNIIPTYMKFLYKGASKMDLNKGAGGRYIYIFHNM